MNSETAKVEYEVIIPFWANWYAEDRSGITCIYSHNPSVNMLFGTWMLHPLNAECISKENKFKVISTLDRNKFWVDSLTRIFPGQSIYIETSNGIR